MAATPLIYRMSEAINAHHLEITELQPRIYLGLIVCQALKTPFVNAKLKILEKIELYRRVVLLKQNFKMIPGLLFLCIITSLMIFK